MSSFQDFYRTLPSSVALNKYQLVKDNGAGSWVVCQNGQAPDAIATVTTDSTMATAAFPIAAELLMKGKIRILQASGAIPYGVPVYSDNSGLITATANGAVVGVALEAATANGDQIMVALAPGNAGVIGVLAAPAAAVAGATSETVMATITIPANSLAVGDIIEVELFFVGSGNSSDTTQVRVRLGGLTGTVIADTTAIATVSASTPGWAKCVFVVEVLGSGTNGKIDASSVPGYFKAQNALLVKGQLNIDTTIAQTIVATVVHGSSNTGNTTTVNQFNGTRRRVA